MKNLLLAFTLRANTICYASAILCGASTLCGSPSFREALPPSPLSLPDVNKSLLIIGDAGNNPDPKTGRGAVAEAFLLGKDDVTAKEYCAFLNAVASTEDTYHLYNQNMGSDKNVNTIIQTPTSTGFEYSVISGRDKFPIVYVSWFSAARYCNWLHNNQKKGPQGPETTETGAYELNGAMKDVETSSESKSYAAITPGAKYFLPTEDQWYKAAYYQGNRYSTAHNSYYNYPTKSDIAPGNTVGSTLSSNEANYFIRTNTDNQSDANGQRTWATWAGISKWNYQYSNGGRAPFLTPCGAFSSKTWSGIVVATTAPYGNVDMGGNAFQWTSGTPGATGSRPIRGGSWKRQMSNELERTYSQTFPADRATDFIGFRIAAPAN